MNYQRWPARPMTREDQAAWDRTMVGQAEDLARALDACGRELTRALRLIQFTAWLENRMRRH